MPIETRDVGVLHGNLVILVSRGGISNEVLQEVRHAGYKTRHQV